MRSRGYKPPKAPPGHRLVTGIRLSVRWVPSESNVAKAEQMVGTNGTVVNSAHWQKRK